MCFSIKAVYLNAQKWTAKSRTFFCFEKYYLELFEYPGKITIFKTFNRDTLVLFVIVLMNVFKSIELFD